MKISIIIPAHNEEDVIEECVNSILNENYEDKEVIVVDDGSTDSTAELLQQYGTAITIVNTGAPHSPGFARNRGVERATGGLLVFIDADELISPGFLTLLAADYPAYHFSHAGINRKSKADNVIAKCFELERAQFPLHIAKQPGWILDQKDIPCFTYIFETNFFKKLGGYSETNFFYEDAHITEKALPLAAMFFDPLLISYHIEPSTLTETFRVGYYKGHGTVANATTYGVFLKAFFHPLSIILVAPYLVISSYRTYKEYKFSKDFKTSFVSNFLVKPLKGIGTAYGVLRYIL